MDPTHVRTIARRRLEWAAVRRELVEAVAQDPADAGIEARADLAGEPERPALHLPDADGDRPEVLRVALAAGPAADDERLLGPQLDLQPGRGPPTGLVPTASMLGDDALEPLRRCGLVERLAAALEVGREPDLRALREDRAQQPLARLEGHLEERAAVELEEVEDLVDDGGLRRLGGVGLATAFGRPAAAASPAPLTGHPAGRLADAELEEREVRPTVCVERDDFAVEDGRLGVEPRSRSGQQPREVRRRVVPVPGVES